MKRFMVTNKSGWSDYFGSVTTAKKIARQMSHLDKKVWHVVDLGWKGTRIRGVGAEAKSQRLAAYYMGEPIDDTRWSRRNRGLPRRDASDLRHFSTGALMKMLRAAMRRGDEGLAEQIGKELDRRGGGFKRTGRDLPLDEYNVYDKNHIVIGHVKAKWLGEAYDKGQEKFGDRFGGCMVITRPSEKREVGVPFRTGRDAGYTFYTVWVAGGSGKPAYQGKDKGKALAVARKLRREGQKPRIEKSYESGTRARQHRALYSSIGPRGMMRAPEALKRRRTGVGTGTRARSWERKRRK